MATRGRQKGTPKTGGRQKGTPNRANAARQKRLSESGVLPAEIQLEAARYHYDRARIERSKARPRAAFVEREYVLASEHATRAAPYVHPKLAAATGHNVNTGATLLELVMASYPKPANANQPALPAPSVDETPEEAAE